LISPVDTKNRFSRGEDLANALSHFAGMFLAAAGLVLMIIYSVNHGNGWHVASSIVFGVSLITLYGSSTLTHWLPDGKAKDSFFAVDQSAIFILIAGTYTPLSLIALKGTLGWILFGIEWVFAIIGIIRVLLRVNNFNSGVKLVDIMLYAVMGWIVVFFAGAVLKNIPVMGFIWIVIGGLIYTLGIIFYKVARFRYHHLIWHLMVIGGSVSHFVAIFFYILPVTI
jgi:hemolysin III